MNPDLKLRYDLDSDKLREKARISVDTSIIKETDNKKWLEAAKAISPKFNTAFAQAVEDIYFGEDAQK